MTNNVLDETIKKIQNFLENNVPFEDEEYVTSLCVLACTTYQCNMNNADVDPNRPDLFLGYEIKKKFKNQSLSSYLLLNKEKELKVNKSSSFPYTLIELLLSVKDLSE